MKRPPSFAEIRDLKGTCVKLRQRTDAQIKSRAWAIIQHHLLSKKAT
jgi:hypothetical protein